MQNEKLQINLGEGITKAEVILREGAATPELAIKAPIKIDLIGVISTPLEYISKRMNLIDQKQAHILVSREHISITLVTQEKDEYNTARITGVLKNHPKAIEFGINTGKVWEPNELGQFFKMNRAFFPDKSANMKLVTDLKNFEAYVNSKVEKQKSEKGDFKDSYSGVVMSNLPEAFVLEIPIFKGLPAETIEVEFYASINGRVVSLQLVSPGANQLLEELRDKVIDDQIYAIRALVQDIPIIEQ